MPPRSYRDNKQRFHKNRQGRILVPHGCLSGLLLTVNPRQEPRAQREAQLYLSGLVSDLEAAHLAWTVAREKEEAGVSKADPADPSDEEEAVVTENIGGTASEAPAMSAASTSSLLAAELADYARPGSKRGRDAVGRFGEENEKDEERGGGDGDGNRGKKEKKNKAAWFSMLETGCKGYLLLHVPTVNPQATCVLCHAGKGQGGDAPRQREDEEKKDEGGDEVAVTSAVATEGEGDASSGVMVPHTIVINPLVSLVVERVFRDLAENPRPVFKQCFRLMPAELTCCPTLPEMQVALRALLAAHFPAPSAASTDEVDGAKDIGNAKASGALLYDAPVPFVSLTAGPAAAAAAGQPARRMHLVSLQFSVKNNTNVEAKKAVWLSALQSALPLNRFIVVPPSQQSKQKVEANICVFVAHATCVMGVQRHFTERHQYNVHAIGTDAFQLDNVVEKNKE